jgi:hypothetical protein
VDKTGRETVLTKARKTPAKRGGKQESTINTAERAVLSAAVICVSEGGNFIPRIIILPRRNM